MISKTVQFLITIKTVANPHYSRGHSMADHDFAIKSIVAKINDIKHIDSIIGKVTSIEKLSKKDTKKLK